MIWTIIKADLLWWVITVPLLVAVNVLQALKARRAQSLARLQAPSWARRTLDASSKFKLAAMRRRRRRGAR